MYLFVYTILDCDTIFVITAFIHSLLNCHADHKSFFNTVVEREIREERREDRKKGSQDREIDRMESDGLSRIEREIWREEREDRVGGERSKEQKRR